MTDYLKEYIATADETEVFNITPIKNNYGTDFLPGNSTEICLTNKRLYIYSIEGDNNKVNTINIDNINHITIGDSQKQTNTNSLTVWSFLITIASVIFAISLEMWLLFILSPIGLITFITSAIIGRTRHQYLLTIHTNQTIIEIDCKKIDDKQIIALQQNIFNLQK